MRSFRQLLHLTPATRAVVVVIVFVVMTAFALTSTVPAQTFGQTSTPATAPQSPPAAQSPAVNEWMDNFDGGKLDADKWEPFSFQGTSGGKVKIEDGQLRLRGIGQSRSGVRSKQSFAGDRFIFEATIAKVESPLPEPEQRETPPGTAVLAIMFDGSGRNRIEWLLTSEKTLEAWSVVDGAGERLDNRRLATKIKNPTLGIVRRGDEFFFMLNGQEGLSKTIKNMPRSFRVMLYGWSSSEDDWDSVRVVTVK